MTRYLSAGILAFFIILLGFGAAHAGMVAIIEAGLEGIFYWIFIGVGLALIFVARGRRPGVDVALGGLSGLLFWAAFGEIGEAGELFEEPAIWGVVGVVSLFLAFRPGTRCDMFCALQRRLGMQEESAPETYWHAPIVAFEFFWLTWVAHMLLLTAYYGPAFGVHSWLTWTILIVTAIATPFIAYYVWKTRDWARGWERGIPAVLVVWSALEILMKWGVVPKPW